MCMSESKFQSHAQRELPLDVGPLSTTYQPSCECSESLTGHYDQVTAECSDRRGAGRINNQGSSYKAEADYLSRGAL